MTIDSREKLIEIREEEQKKIESCDCRILVCSGTGCIATGSQKIYERFLEIEGCTGSDDRIWTA